MNRQRGRDQVGQKDADAHAFAPSSRQPRKADRGRHGEHHRDHHDREAHEERVQQESRKQRLVEEQVEMFQREVLRSTRTDCWWD